MKLITGCTGFLGSELLGRLLLNSSEEIAVLVRPSRHLSGEERIKQVLEQVFHSKDISAFSSRVRVVNGDLLEDDLGLGCTEFQSLSEQVDTVFHCAASTSFGQSLEDARRINVGGTEKLLKFADLGAKTSQSAMRFHHVSTAFVAGHTKRIVSPEELKIDHRFRNSYEQSKAEAEALVQGYADVLDITTYRPSIIVGDSVTGQTSSFNVIYIPTRCILQGLLSTLPAQPNTPCDLVPIDYVVDAMMALSGTRESIGHTYHLCSGVGREATLREMVELIVSAFNKYRRRGLKFLHVPPIVAPEMFNLAQNSLRMLGEMFHLLQYMVFNPRFDTRKTSSVLDGIIAPPPLFQDYVEKMIRYCLDTNWGRKPWTNPAGEKVWFHRSPAGVYI